jgi:hypothetical protein
MHRSRDKLGIFLPRFYNQSVGPIGSERKEQEWSPELLIIEDSPEQIFEESVEEFGDWETSSFSYFSLFTMVDEREEGRVEGRNEEEKEMFEFPILETWEQVRMKNINPTTLPHFHGMITKDPNTFLFEFEVLCKDL